MVEVEEISYGDGRAVLRTSKRSDAYILQKEIPRGPFFIFKTTRSSLPKALEGRFTSIEDGIRVFEYFDRITKPSHKKKQEEIAADKEKLHARLRSKGT